MVLFLYLYSLQTELVMRYVFIIATFLLAILFSCKTTEKFDALSTEKITSDTISISNPAIEYEVLIVDSQFRSWFNTNARPKSAYSLGFLEAKNKFWVLEWNRRANSPQHYGTIYDFPINYDNSTNYGFDVNYMIYNYLVFFQYAHKQQLGGAPASL